MDSKKLEDKIEERFRMRKERDVKNEKDSTKKATRFFMCNELGEPQLYTQREMDADRELLNEVAASCIEWDAGKYVTVQIDKETWACLKSTRPKE